VADKCSESHIFRFDITVYHSERVAFSKRCGNISNHIAANSITITSELSNESVEEAEVEINAKAEVEVRDRSSCRCLCSPQAAETILRVNLPASSIVYNVEDRDTPCTSHTQWCTYSRDQHSVTSYRNANHNSFSLGKLSMNLTTLGALDNNVPK
jgi:hypothetical protein